MEVRYDQKYGAEAANALRAEIYGEDGVILTSFLAHIGTAIC